MFLDVVEISRSRVHYHYFLIYSLEIFNVKFTFQNIFIFSLLQMPIVVEKSVNLLLTKFTPKASQT